MSQGKRQESEFFQDLGRSVTRYLSITPKNTSGRSAAHIVADAERGWLGAYLVPTDPAFHPASCLCDGCTTPKVLVIKEHGLDCRCEPCIQRALDKLVKLSEDSLCENR